MTELRILLLVIGLVVIGAIYWFGTHPIRFGGQADKPRERREPSLGGADMDAEAESELDRLAAAIKTDEPSPASLIDTPHRGVDEPTPQRQPPADIAMLHLHAREGRVFRGADILDSARKTGLEYGDRQIFHRYQDGSNPREVVFSVASMVNPGAIPMQNLSEYETPGLTLFMGLPGPASALASWDAMHAAGKRLAELLGGQLRDESHSAMTREVVAQSRERMRSFDREREA